MLACWLGVTATSLSAVAGQDLMKACECMTGGFGQTTAVHHFANRQDQLEHPDTAGRHAGPGCGSSGVSGASSTSCALLPVSCALLCGCQGQSANCSAHLACHDAWSAKNVMCQHATSAGAHICFNGLSFTRCIAENVMTFSDADSVYHHVSSLRQQQYFTDIHSVPVGLLQAERGPYLLPFWRPLRNVQADTWELLSFRLGQPFDMRITSSSGKQVLIRFDFHPLTTICATLNLPLMMFVMMQYQIGILHNLLQQFLFQITAWTEALPLYALLKS